MVELFRKLNGTHRNIPKTKRCTFIFLALTHNIATILPDCHRMSSCMFRYVVVWQLFVFRWDCGVVALSYTSESCGFFCKSFCFSIFRCYTGPRLFCTPPASTHAIKCRSYLCLSLGLCVAVFVWKKTKCCFNQWEDPHILLTLL